MLEAKKREMRREIRTPSFAISCLTVGERGSQFW